MGEIDIVPVDGKRGLKEFIEFPYALYRQNQHWVAPLRIAVNELLDRKKHPFYANAEAEFFLAYRAGRVVGRIAAIVDRNHNRFHDENAGFFGFFEAENNLAVAQALLGAARKWVFERGAKLLRGPVNPSTNYECGILVEGFESDPKIIMTYNPPYYSDLMKQAGLRKAKDLYAYGGLAPNVDIRKIERVANRALAKHEFRIRTIDMKNFNADVMRVWEVYNSAWSRNWGFVPMTREEFFLMGKEMKQILKPELVLIGEVKGKAVGFALALPNVNHALKKAKGNLFPAGLLKILYYQRLIKDVRVFALGVTEEYRTTGVAAGFYATLVRNALKLGYDGECEMSWILEDNTLMNRSAELMGAKRYKTLPNLRMELSAMSASATSSSARKKSSGSNDIFEKCRNFTRPNDLQDAGLYMYFEVFEERKGCEPGEVRLGNRKVLMFGSNDYLDLITHPKVLEAATLAISQYGSGCSGSRLLNGTLDLHVSLEQKLAAFMKKEAAVIFGTGFQANYAALSALTEKGDAMICDHNLHASLVEGALRSPARTARFRHNDLDHFERCLENCPPQEKVLVITEGVFSMEGDIANLCGIVKLAKLYGARVYVDEAHGIGVLGNNGAGASEHLGVLEDVDIVMGTFSKSMASVGGFIAGERSVVDYLKHTARPFVFSASLPAASVAAAGAALHIIQNEPERRQHLLHIARQLRGELRSRGFVVLDGETAIVPVVIQDEVSLCRLCKALLAEGIYINPVLRPAAAQNLLRISCTAAHSEAHVERLVSTLEKVADKLGIERNSS